MGRRLNEEPCFWKGPAFETVFNPEGGFIKSETHHMLSQRVENQEGFGDLTATWDEVVIDTELMLHALQWDPAIVVPAFVYQDNGDESKTGIAKKMAAKMADAMMKEFNMDQPVPVVGVDTRLHVAAQPDVPGPFFYGKKYTTQTTTTTPRIEAACCQGGCEQSNQCFPKNEYCGQNKDNCQGCSGVWCPPPMHGTIV